jgi:hypothetical protein
VYDSGDLPQTLDTALALIDYEQALELKRKVAESGSSKRIGIGIGSTLDSGTNNFGQAGSSTRTSRSRATARPRP